MKLFKPCVVFFTYLLILSSSLQAQEPVDQTIDALRSAINELKQDYDSRIQDLENRLAAAEAQVQQVNLQVTSRPSANTQTSSSSAFNPAIGVIFEGLAWNFDMNPEDYQIPGFPLGGEAGLVPQGLSLGETEIDISANVDDKFTAFLTAPIVLEDGEAHIEIEEAWIETTSLPAGLSARFGRFFSNIGYLNNKHAHSWDFVDQPLNYQVFLGNQYLDDGIQMRWLAPTDIYLELGGEILRGDRYPSAGSTHSGFGSRTIFARTGGDVGDSHSWLSGISYLRTSSNARSTGDNDNPLLFSGDTDLLIAELVWKWSPFGNIHQRNFVFQMEYMFRNEKGEYTLPDNSNVLPWDVNQSGLYTQAIYQPFPRWRFGVRYDRLFTDEPGPLFTNTLLDPIGNEPRRYSFMVDWSNSEFSRLRFQLTQDEAGLGSDTQFGFQYIHSIGAHGAHSF
jgi:hypothetical protein